MCSLGFIVSYTDKTVGIPMGTNSTLFLSDLFLFCYVRDFIYKIFFLIIKKLKSFKYQTLHLDI